MNYKIIHIDNNTFYITPNGLVQSYILPFYVAWLELADDGACDNIGGAEYRRVVREWIYNGMDIKNLRTFIFKRANASPEDLYINTIDLEDSIPNFINKKYLDLSD